VLLGTSSLQLTSVPWDLLASVGQGGSPAYSQAPDLLVASAGQGLPT
jgi:hypothetical protein